MNALATSAGVVNDSEMASRHQVDLSTLVNLERGEEGCPDSHARGQNGVPVPQTALTALRCVGAT